MGVFQRYRDKDGKPTGPWFVRYPVKRDETGKIVYRRSRAGDSKMHAKRLLATKTSEFEARDRRGDDYIEDLFFSKLIDWYLEHPAARSKRSYYKDIQRSKALKVNFGHIKASRIKPYIIEEYQQKRLRENSYKGTPLKPATVNREFALMRRIFNLAKRDGLVERNPCEKVSILPERNRRDRILSHSEYKKLIFELKEPVRSIVKVAYFTGMRKGEILGLTWDQVNLNEGSIDLDYGDTKTGERRRIYFNRDLHDIFRIASGLRSINHRHVFIQKNGEPVKDFRKAFTLACRRAGITDFVFHDLRHTFNTNMRKAGVDRTVIMDITGHKTTEMFLRYNTVDDYDVREAMERLSNYLEEGSEKGLKESGTKVEHDENFNQP